MSGGDARSFWRENALSLVVGALLLAALVGQAVSGLALYNQEATTQGLQPVSLLRYVSSSRFAVDVAENWQSEFLQFALYIWLTAWLVQKGSSESKQPGEEGRESDEAQLVGPFARAGSPRWARTGGWRTWVFSHSLVLVMTAIFVLSWTAQWVAGRVAVNEERMRDLLEPLDLGQYLLAPDFWSRTFQNWQSEMLAIGTMVVFTIYLRERGSPESKEVGTPASETSSSD
jgi:hypothetical protein